MVYYRSPIQDERRVRKERRESVKSTLGDLGGLGVPLGAVLLSRIRSTSQYEGRTTRTARDESPAMALVVDQASHFEFRDLAGVFQGPYKGEINPLRRDGPRGALLRMD
jgi:hypothetical protein